jgi:rubrerythrin
MPGKRIMFAFVVALALALAGCGGEGDDPPSEGEKADDIAILNTALGYELTAVDAYSGALPLLRGETLTVVREFRAQEQEHVNAITKAIRGLNGRADPQPPELGRNAFSSYSKENALRPAAADALALAYERVSAAIAEDMSAVANLTASWPRALLTSVAANEAQQLTVLRQALGAGPAASVPEAFENGETPLP